MRTVGALLLAFFVSIFVAGIVQNQLAIAFGAGEEFIAVMMLFVLSAIVTTIAFGVALALSSSVAVIDWAALALLGLVAVMIAALVLLGAGTSQLTIGRGDLPILAEIVVPTALVIGIQWWLVRRRRQKAQRGRADRRVQGADREPGDDGGVSGRIAPEGFHLLKFSMAL